MSSPLTNFLAVAVDTLKAFRCASSGSRTQAGNLSMSGLLSSDSTAKMCGLVLMITYT